MPGCENPQYFIRFLEVVALLVGQEEYVSVEGHVEDEQAEQDSADDLGDVRRVLPHVGRDEGEEGDGLPGARGHLEETVAFGIEGPLQLEHVGELLRIDIIVGEVDQKAPDVELHFSVGDH